MSCPKIVMFCGGVGGARAALALQENLPADKLTFVVNTGDDFQHLGLTVWPDWDTVVYHLSGLQDSARGWGRADEGTKAMEEFTRLGAPDWFHLGDRDLALHVTRTWARQNNPGWKVALELRQRLGLQCEVLPCTEESLESQLVLDNDQIMGFQDWFVGKQCGPTVKAVRQKGLPGARLSKGVLEALRSCELVLFAPSNPYLSIQPMLRVPELATVLPSLTCPKWAISPLIGGKALKGPLDRLIATLSAKSGQQAVLEFYRRWANLVFMPTEEVPQEEPLARGCHTLLKDSDNRRRFVEELLEHWSS